MNRPSWRGLAALPVIAAACGVAAGCSHAAPAISQCAVVTGYGFGSSQNIVAVAHPGDKIQVGNGDTAWYYPCDARNYVTAPSGGDRSAPMSVRTGTGPGGAPGMPVQVWTAVYFTPNQDDPAMKAFLPFCLKYGCASDSTQTDNSVSSLAHSSTPGWNNMLAENFGPAVDRATQDVIGKFGPTLWTDHSQWAALGNLIAASFNAELEKETGNSTPFFCGDSSTVTNCTQVQVVVSNVTPTDPQVGAEYNQEIAAENALAANTARLKAAQELYGPYAQYFLGIQDTAADCKTCTIYIGAPGTIPTPAAK